MVRVLIAGATLALSGCLDVDVSNGGGGHGSGRSGSGGGEPICQVVGSPSYNNLGFADPARALDADLATFATLSPGSSASGTLTATHIDRMAGEVAGVAITRPFAGTVSVSITTYKNNVPVDSGQAGTTTFTNSGGIQTCPGQHCFERDGMAFFGIPTTGDFDQLEASISITNLPSPLELRELCVS